VASDIDLASRCTAAGTLGKGEKEQSSAMTKEQKFKEWWNKQELGRFDYANTTHFIIRCAFYAGMEAVK
jgi:hypothetical protein